MALGLLCSPALAAPTISFTGGGSENAAGTTVFQSFNALADGTSIGSSAFVYSNSGTTASRPSGADGNFAAVLGGGTFATTFAASSVFSFVVGSLDTYNTLRLTFDDGTSSSYEGGAIIGGGAFDSGSRTSARSNGLVTFNTGTGPRITGATFTSGTNSFEFDTLASNGVPEPATWALMILGFGAVSGAMRRRSRAGLATA